MTDFLKKKFIKAKKRAFDIYYSDLNDAQREAIYTVNGPLLVLAGAGSGKTSVLVRRIAHIMRFGNSYYSEEIPQGLTEEAVADLEMIPGSIDRKILASILDMYSTPGCEPWQMMSITFTNKAADEMKTRLCALLGEEKSRDIASGTFHSICVRILRRYTEYVGLRSGFTIYDTDDSKKVLSQCIKDMNLDDKMFPVKTVMNIISRSKDSLVTPDEYIISASNDYKQQKIGKIYKQYEKRLEEANAVDFDDIIFKTVALLRDNAEVREYYQRRYKYLCIDEYQDTNKAQFELARLLSGKYCNIMVVGDDDQSIYRFRGATIENILTFDNTYPSAKTVKLEQNYRSCGNILDAANSVIGNNKGRKGKQLWSANGMGEKVHLVKLSNQNDEGRFVASKITELIAKEGLKYGDFAVLYRMNTQSNSIEASLVKSGIPYRVLAGKRFYDRKEIRDVVAYLTLIVNNDDDVRLERIINEPKRKIGATTVNAVRELAHLQGVSMFDIMSKADQYTSIAKSAEKLGDFCLMIRSLGERSHEMPLHVFIEEVVEKTGYKEMLISLGEAEKERIDNVGELISNAAEYEKNAEDPSLRGFLENIALMSDVDNYDRTADAVVMMTIHSAKGLEFPTVFLVGMEEGIFPSMQTIVNPEEIEEERRLAYVALTRAKRKLYVTYAHERMIFGRTQNNPKSRFISEMSKESYDFTDKHAEQYGNQRKSLESKSASASTGNLSVLNLYGTAGQKKTQDATISAGDRVKHLIFGEGDVLSVTNMGGEYLYEVAFDKVGTKRLMGSHCKLKKI